MATLYADVNAIRAEARILDPLKVLITLVSLLPFILGWAARVVWVLISLLWTGGVFGWRTATEQLDARRGVGGD